MMTQSNSSFIGHKDRETLCVGMKADINVIDYDNLRVKRPRISADLPAGGQRLLQDTEGYLCTILNGQVTIENGQLTDARPERLVRIGQ